LKKFFYRFLEIAVIMILVWAISCAFLERRAFGISSDIHSLNTALKDEHRVQSVNPQVRSAVALALGKIGDPQAVNSIITALKDSKPTVRRATIQALGVIKDPQAVEALIESLGDEDRFVRRMAAEALEKLVILRQQSLSLKLWETETRVFALRQQKLSEKLKTLGQ